MIRFIHGKHIASHMFREFIVWAFHSVHIFDILGQ
jgi:hypothetical protein